MVVFMAREVMAPSVVMFGVVVVLLIVGIVNPREAFSGFSNPAPFTVAALYVVARAVEKTGAIQPSIQKILGRGSGERTELMRLLLPTAVASAFLNNTPIMATLIPQVTDWAERWGKPISLFLMPLSFATILAGTITVIGTSTNIVVSGLLEADGAPPIGMFELSPIGLPLTVVGLLTLILLAPRVLPDRRPARQRFEDEFREFVVPMRIEGKGPLVGKTVEEAGLRHLQGVFLAELERDGQIIAPVSPDEPLAEGDLLTFVGLADLVVDLQGMRGLAFAGHETVSGFAGNNHTFFEAVLSASSPLTGRTLIDADFRNRYQAAVFAIHRAGTRVKAKLGSVRLKTGDTLLVLSDQGFRDRWRDRSDFLLVSRLGGALPVSSGKAWIVGLITLGIVVVAGVGWLPILHCALIGTVTLIVSGVLSPQEARAAVNLDVVVVIAASFGVGAAIQVSGLAEVIGSGIVGVFGGWGATGLLLGLALATILFTELITNNATAVLLFPVATATAGSLGLDPRPFAIVVAIAASASFLTPIGYQTNMMIYGPGGYRFGDYARLGLPLTLLVIVVLVLLVPVVWPM
ncbi:MAG: SLC13 family permease [Longimicrobiaceae bacterium]